MNAEENRDAADAVALLAACEKDELVAVLCRAIERLGSLESKYWHLVWYARKDPFDPPPGARELMTRIEASYPSEVQALSGWEHGFNSGVLATVRLLGAYVDVVAVCENVNRQTLEERESMSEAEYEVMYGPWAAWTPEDAIGQAEEEFPWLDT